MGRLTAVGYGTCRRMAGKSSRPRMSGQTGTCYEQKCNRSDAGQAMCAPRATHDAPAGADRVRDLFLNQTIALAKRSYTNCRNGPRPRSYPRRPRAGGDPALNQRRIQIIPLRVVSLDEPQLPSPMPLLQLLFTQDSTWDIWADFIINQAMNTILPCKTIDAS